MHTPPQHPTFTLALSALLALSVCACRAGDAPSTANAAKAPGVTQSAQTAPTTTPALTDTQVKALYQNCPNGHYSGPRPGKVRYAKDPYIWVVTPQFASKFCMPPEFISTELKGVEAIAFRVTGASDDDNCGIGGTAGACFSMKQLRFELFIDSAAKLPKAHDGVYFQVPMLGSGTFITKTDKELIARRKFAQKITPSTLKPHFDGVALVGTHAGKIVWPLGMMSEETHYAGKFEGLDYYAFESNTGNFGSPGLAHNGVSGIAIVFDKLDYDRTKKIYEYSLSDMAYVIELPTAFAHRVAQEDLTKGMNFEGLRRKAFQLAPAAPVTTVTPKAPPSPPPSLRP